jgi:putative heme iron utilization protein
MSKPIWESRTVWANIIATVVAIAGVVLEMSDALALPDKWEVYLTLGIAIMNIFLRTLTTQPVRWTN